MCYTEVFSSIMAKYEIENVKHFLFKNVKEISMTIFLSYEINIGKKGIFSHLQMAYNFCLMEEIPSDLMKIDNPLFSLVFWGVFCYFL